MKSKPISSLLLLVCLVLGSPATLAADAASAHRWIKQQEAAGKIAAAAVADVRGGDIRVQGFGHRSAHDTRSPDAQTQFQIGSITKVFTNLLLAEMVEAGRLTASATLGELMPDGFAPRNPAIALIRLHALSTHSSGLPSLPANLDLSNSRDPYAGYDAAALQEGLSMARDGQPLGAIYTYSNFGVGTLGHVLGRLDGKGYSAALRNRVITPLGLQRTAFAPDANAASAVVAGQPVTPWQFQDALAGAGALWGSAEDLGRLVQVYLGTREHGLDHSLDADLKVQDMRAGTFEVTPVWHVARADGQPIYWHNGGTAGFWSFVGFRPDQQRGIAILVSGDADPTAAGLAALGHVAPAAMTSSIDAGVAGTYELSDDFAIRVFEQAGVLLAQASGQPPLRIRAVGDDWYAYGDVDASLRFLRHDGEVTGLELVQGGRVNRASRLAEQSAVHDVPAAPGAAGSVGEPKPQAVTLESYAGSYAFAPGVELRIRRQGKGLQARLSGQSWLPIDARGRDRFAYTAVDAQLQFLRDEAGRVDAVVLHQGGVEQRAARLP